jgi:hypothetical protein
MFIGYAGNSAAYRFLVLKSDVLEEMGTWVGREEGGV